MQRGWRAIAESVSWLERDEFPLAAYSEFMPAPRLGVKPFGGLDRAWFRPDDPHGWYVDEFEERLELQPGLETIAGQLIEKLARLGAGLATHGIAKKKLEGRSIWPPTFGLMGGGRRPRADLHPQGRDAGRGG